MWLNVGVAPTMATRGPVIKYDIVTHLPTVTGFWRHSGKNEFKTKHSDYEVLLTALVCITWSASQQPWLWAHACTLYIRDCSLQHLHIHMLHMAVPWWYPNTLYIQGCSPATPSQLFPSHGCSLAVPPIPFMYKAVHLQHVVTDSRPFCLLTSVSLENLQSCLFLYKHSGLITEKTAFSLPFFSTLWSKYLWIVWH